MILTRKRFCFLYFNTNFSRHKLLQISIQQIFILWNKSPTHTSALFHLKQQKIWCTLYSYNFQDTTTDTNIHSSYSWYSSSARLHLDFWFVLYKMSKEVQYSSSKYHFKLFRKIKLNRNCILKLCTENSYSHFSWRTTPIYWNNLCWEAQVQWFCVNIKTHQGKVWIVFSWISWKPCMLIFCWKADNLNHVISKIYKTENNISITWKTIRSHVKQLR